MCGGGGGSQTVTNVQEFKPPAWLQPMWQTYANQGMAASQTPYQQYDGDRMAQNNPTQSYGSQAYIDRVAYGNATDNAARGLITSTMEGAFQDPYAQQRIDLPFNPVAGASTQVGQNGYLDAGNPYRDSFTETGRNGYLGYVSDPGTNDYIGAKTNVAQNGYMGAETNNAYAANDYNGAQTDAAWQKNSLAGPAGESLLNPMIGQSSMGLNQRNAYAQAEANPMQNPYAGMANPYFGMSLANALGDAANAFGTATMPGINAQATFNNAFGGSGHELLQQQAQGALGKQLGNIATDAYMGEYRNQQGLAERAIDRSLSADQANLARMSGLDESFINRGMNLGLGDINRDSNLLESGIGRMQADLESRRGLSENYLNRTTQAQQGDLARNAGLSENYLNRITQAQQGDLARNSGLYGDWLNRSENAQQTDLARNSGLVESGLQRYLGAQQTDLARNSGLMENMLNRNVAAQQTDLARNAGLYGEDLSRNANLAEAGLNRSVGAQQTDLARNAGIYDSMINRGQNQFNTDRAFSSGAWNQGLDRALGLVPQAMGMQQQDLRNYQGIIGLGDAQRQQDQQALDLQYQDWLANRQYPLQQLDILGNVLSRASGTSSQNTQTTASGNTPPWAPIMALASLMM